MSFIPENMSILGLTNHEMVGNAMGLVFRTLGFGKVEISSTDEVCFFGGQIQPKFIWFAPDWLHLRKIVNWA